MPIKGIDEDSIAYKFYVANETDDKTFENEKLLPSLPVPSLDNTINKYLKSIRPFTSPEEFEISYDIAKNFKNGVGKELHEQLLERAKTNKNWVDEWWLNYCYLSLRGPLAPCINMAGVQSLHFTLWTDPSEDNAIERAAISIWAKLQFYLLLREEKLKPQFSSQGERLSMNQFRFLYNTTRIPSEGMDYLHTGFKTVKEGNCSQHLIVLSHGHIWVLNPWDSEGGLLSVLELEQKLKYIQSISEALGDAEGVAALTADHREVWAKNRRWLSSLSKNNADNLALIETAISVVILDDQTPKNYSEAFYLSLCGNPINRWADKSYGAIMFKNGYFTSTNDHSPYDAMVTVVLGHFQHELITHHFSEGIDRSVPLNKKVQMPTRIHFELDNLLLDAIQKAKKINTAFRENVGASMFVFPHFGKDFMKKQKFHPDAFIQCALQLSYYRLHNKFAPTYETATTRQYYHARTETVRTCSEEVVDWVQAMVDDTKSIAEKKLKMSTAIEMHVKQMKECQNAQGIDRHLFGLSILAMENKMPMPDLFTNPAYTKSGGNGNFILSTSTIGYTYMIGGVGAMVEDGYGIFYSILPDTLNFTMTNFKSGDTSIEAMRSSIINALLEMRTLCNAVSSKF